MGGSVGRAPAHTAADPDSNPGPGQNLFSKLTAELFLISEIRYKRLDDLKNEKIRK